MEPEGEEEFDIPRRDLNRKRAMPTSRLHAQSTLLPDTLMSTIRQYPSTVLPADVDAFEHPQHEDKRQRQPSRSDTVLHRMPMDNPEAAFMTPSSSTDVSDEASQFAYPDPAVQANFRRSAGVAAFVAPLDYAAESIADDPRMFFGAPVPFWELVDKDEYEDDFPSLL